MTEDLIRDLLSASTSEMTRLANEVSQLRVGQMELVRIGERQANTLDQVKAVSETIADHEKRLRQIEVRQPQLMEARTWLLVAAAAVISVFFSFVSGRILAADTPVSHPPRPAIVDTRSMAVVVA